MKGFDCAAALTYETAAAFKAAGYEFVCRYYPVGLWKSLTREEAAAVSSAGLKIITVFETAADRALSGYEAGLEDGKCALEAAVGVGQPAGSCIYFAVDFDAQPWQMAAITDYIRGCSEATPDYTTGVYGPYSVIQNVQAAAVCSHYWQTYAWSRGAKMGGIHVYQYQNDVTECGVGVDLNESYGDEGAWEPAEPVAPTPPPPAPPISAADANAIIDRWISHEYDKASDADQTERHRLANVLRAASGQTTEVNV